VTRAADALHLTPQTISSQLRVFERSIGQQLFDRVGRKLLLTEVGHVAFHYANEIFALGAELSATVRGLPTDRAMKLSIGVVDALPKTIAYRLIEPALQLDLRLRLVCREGPAEKLLADLAIHELDVVLSDHPIPQGFRIGAYNHRLGSCGTTLMAKTEIARRLRKGFPASLDRQPVLLPGENSTLRREIDQWFLRCGVEPIIAGEFDDSALVKVFGHEGVGFFAVPTVIVRDLCRQYDVQPIGTASDVNETFFAISKERRVHNPAIAAICVSARAELFADRPSSSGISAELERSEKAGLRPV
jgi:LysR family transcriptional activator of nhaA